MLTSGGDGLLTGDRRSDRLSFCHQEAGQRFMLSDRTLRLFDGSKNRALHWKERYAQSVV
jgi:hypothetical protein